MKKQLIRILLLVIIILTLGFYLLTEGVVFRTRAGIVNDLRFTYPGGLTPEKLFNKTDFKPGDCQNATVGVENLGADSDIVGIFSDGEVEPDGLSTALTITISDDFGILYGPKSLADFFAESLVENEIKLMNLAGGDSAKLHLQICFDNTDDNELQGDQVVFDLKFGEIKPPVELPDVCADLEGIVTEVIEGTPGNDVLYGTTASELIIGHEGNDKIKGKGGHDCIIGGAGDDKASGGSGNDIITGDEGEDNIKGGSGNDVIHGGSENDEINAGTGNDTVYGDAGNDDIKGSSGIDVIEGGEGNDEIKGGSGTDVLLGGPGDDEIKGGSGGDFLDGESDTDDLNGNSGSDTCTGGETYSSCETII